MDPNGKVALVTGGASGIGLACVKELLDNGAKVALCDVDVKAAKDAMDELTKKHGSNVIFIKVDVTDQVAFEEAFKKTISQFGGLDIVVNNAGIFDETRWELEVDINLKGVIRGCLLGFQYLGKDNGGNGGVIVNTGSTGSIAYMPTLPIYIATKHGVLAATKSFGMPFHYDRNGVRVVAMLPSSTISPLSETCTQRVLRPEWTEWTNNLFSTIIQQPAEACGKTLLRMIREAENGAAWVSEGGENFLVTIPPPEAMRTKI